MPRLLRHEPALHYQAVGDGETVVLIHGLGANLAFWFMGIARQLARRYRVITYDLRGHGASGMPPRGYLLSDMVDDLQALLDHLGVERAHIAGHSFGARVALAQAILHPDRVETLTVADTQLRCLQAPLRLREWPHWPQWKRKLLKQGHVGLPEDDEYITFQLLVRFNEFAPQLTTRGGLTSRGQRPSLRRRDMGRKGAARWQRLMEATSASKDLSDERPLSAERIRAIRAPTLAVFGEFSHCLASCRRLSQLIDDCQVSIVPGAGHFHPAVKPGRFARTLDAFLRQRHGSRVRSDAGIRARFVGE